MSIKGILQSISVLVVTCGLASGCSPDDPNDNAKVRYAMAVDHAGLVLRESKSELRPYGPDYDLMEFYHRFYDENTHVFHDHELYDFLKTSPKPGPERFVIVYDFGTRKTYLRTDLRSNENIEKLPTSQPSQK